MIIKELEEFYSTDKFLLAGRRAEEQMAFYLRRYFSTTEDVYVINGLNLGKDGESLQIDHFVIHQNGIFIIESKSVSGKISIKNDFQWIRKYHENSSGMKSPVIQAEMQKMLLTSIIEEIESRYRCRFPINNIECLVAISDNGIIEWPDSGPIPGVYKADQICKKIQIRLEEFKNKKINKIPDEDISDWIKINIVEKKYAGVMEIFHPDSIMEPRGNFPEWIAEFFCGCHLAHLEIRKNIIPMILRKKLPENTIKILEEVNSITKSEIAEIYTYALIWRETFQARNDCFTTARNIARYKYMYPNGRPPTIVNRPGKKSIS